MGQSEKTSEMRNTAVLLALVCVTGPSLASPIISPSALIRTLRNIAGKFSKRNNVPGKLKRQLDTYGSFGGASDSSLNQADLIARIISSLQPQIQSAVSSALRPSPRSTLVEQPRISSASNGLEGTFGNGQTSVNIATPEFQIAY